MLIPLGYGWVTESGGLEPLAYSAIITVLFGGGGLLYFRSKPKELNQRECLLMVVFIWLGVVSFGSLPFYLSPYFGSFTDAFFESVSGFTTTGATILIQVEVLPEALQFWRCFTHWLGGMGIVLLGIAVLPLLGNGGMQLYRAEFSGAKSERLTPRITETAFSLWKIYLALTVFSFISLWAAGMSAFDALCHAFSTAATGGFSTSTESIGGFNNPLIEMIVIVVMLLSGVSFVQHYHMWIERKPRQVLEDVEVRYYFLIVGSMTVLIGAILIFNDGYGVPRAFLSSLFQVVAILTTSGFVTDDYEAWHALPQLILLTLMFVGGCTGSTSGGMKTSRILLMARVVDREFKKMVERRGVFAVRLGGSVVPESTIQGLLNLVYLAFLVNFGSCLLLAAMGVDVMTAISAVAAAMFNVGPALGSVGPTENYAHLPSLAKWVLAGDMIAGRLEFYTVIVILTPAFWRK